MERTAQAYAGLDDETGGIVRLIDVDDGKAHAAVLRRKNQIFFSDQRSIHSRFKEADRKKVISVLDMIAQSFEPDFDLTGLVSRIRLEDDKEQMATTEYFFIICSAAGEKEGSLPVPLVVKQKPTDSDAAKFFGDGTIIIYGQWLPRTYADLCHEVAHALYAYVAPYQKRRLSRLFGKMQDGIRARIIEGHTPLSAAMHTGLPGAYGILGKASRKKGEEIYLGKHKKYGLPRLVRLSHIERIDAEDAARYRFGGHWQVTIPAFMALSTDPEETFCDSYAVVQDTKARKKFVGSNGRPHTICETAQRWYAAIGEILKEQYGGANVTARFVEEMRTKA